MFVGVIVSAVLYGMICTQAIYYYTRKNKTMSPGMQNYATDSKKLKFLVCILDKATRDDRWLTLPPSEEWCFLDRVFIDGLTSNPGALEYVTWTLVCINGAAVQWATCSRELTVKTVSLKNIWITIPILLLVIGDISAFSILIAIVYMGVMHCLARQSGSALQVHEILLRSFCRSSKSRWQLPSLPLQRTCLLQLPYAFYCVDLELGTRGGDVNALCHKFRSLIILPDSDVYATFYFCIGRLYTNSLLATLNARRGLRAHTSSAEQELAFSSGRSNLSGGAIPRTTTSQQRTRVSDMPVRIDNIHEFHTHDSSSTPDLPKTDYQRDFHT
ncbi:hypothetical protein FISHEDRAFT_61731 [Fistulina hepatica ATCC 64428]|uniref:DUF6534 domain-containing protein n=1 Tax=Fistulina hepatica ATCC 64428 TaxID=1128425 RepID=A0A0D7A1K1_9AGAR|nr:hypothetical protein FISHEDRAFT_61731 [Fistulina hepatica ATCC 64428]